jgi:hypothetical protein
MADIKYNWYFLSIRPRNGWHIIEETKKEKFLFWLIYISTSYKIVEEKEGQESHIHALICLEEETKVDNMISKLRNNLKNMLNLSKSEIHVSSNKNKAVQVVNNLEEKLIYISGNYQDDKKDKSKEYFKILKENLKDIEKDKLKIKQFIIPEKKERISILDKIINYIKNNLEEDKFYNIHQFETIFFEGQASEEIPIIGSDFLEKKYIALSYCKFMKIKQKPYKDIIKYKDFIKIEFENKSL